MASSNEATPNVSTNCRPPTLTRLLATSPFVLHPAADAGTTAYDCVARLGGLKWDTPASPGVRVLSSFFDLLEQHPSLLELFREENLDALSNAPRRRLPRKSEDNAKVSFGGLFFGGLQSGDAAQPSRRDHRGRRKFFRSRIDLRDDTPGNVVLYIQRGAGNVVSNISIEYQWDNVHHRLAKVLQEGALSHIPILDHGAPVPLQDLEEETSKGADAVATKAIIQCVSSDSRFFLLVSIPFFQIGELKAAETLGTDLPRRSLIVSFIALAFTAVIEVPKPDQAVVDSLLDTQVQPPNRPRPCSEPDSDPDYDPSPRVQKAQETSADATGARSSGRLAVQPPLAQAKDSNRPITPPVSVGLQSDTSSDPLTPVTRIFSSPPASTDWSPTSSPLSGSRLPSKSIIIVQDREFVIKASLSNAHWSTMSYTGTSRVDLVEIGFDIVSSIPFDSPLPSRLSSKPSPASDFIRGLHLSDAVLRWLSENPREELEDDRMPLELLDRFEPTADLRLEKQVGTGSTAGGWLANVVRVNLPLSSSAKAEVPFVDHPAPNTRYFLKFVTCNYVGSIIRETLFYQHVFPHLPDYLQKHLPQYHGTYRRTNGNGYAMVLENVGMTINDLDFYESPGQLWEIEATFRELGIIHNDVSAGNVLVRPNNGRLCFVDWGRSSNSETKQPTRWHRALKALVPTPIFSYLQTGNFPAEWSIATQDQWKDYVRSVLFNSLHPSIQDVYQEDDTPSQVYITLKERYSPRDAQAYAKLIQQFWSMPQIPLSSKDDFDKHLNHDLDLAREIRQGNLDIEQVLVATRLFSTNFNNVTYPLLLGIFVCSLRCSS
ncbi:BQ5605_C020g09187 [Microbotryum silenes-dioicae]|uniref:BQ5605_C020g09187 protein n=1 Tax=Microbotryum silenes-dioicae TaxID=796604 RepID=A0A2X0MNS1_9BASI|nr:BQ5605_C020g09187 [Microbotryum silenes-dioicae]